jgi:MFS family permease
MRTTELAESNPRYPGWQVTLSSSGCVFFSFASVLVYTFGIFLKPLSAEFGWSRAATSAAFGLAALSVAACSPVLGYLLDRYPARRIIVPCFIVFGGAFCSLGLLTNHLWHLYAIFVVLGVVGNGTAHLAYARTLSSWFSERRGLAFAILMAGGAAGAMVLPPVAQWLITSLGWRSAFVVLGALVLAVGLPLASQVRERRDARAGAGRNETGASAVEGLRSRIFWIIITVLFLCSLSQNGALAHLPALLTDRGISAAESALAASAMGGAVLVGRLATGALLDRFFAPRVAFVLLGLASLGTLILARAASLEAGVLGAVLIGLGMGGEADVTPYLLSKYFGLRSLSVLYGFSWTAYAIAGAIGPVIMGRAFDAAGSYRTMLAALALLTVVAASLMLLLPRYKANNRAGTLAKSRATADCA